MIVSQISENNDIWESISGEITQSSASSQIDNYNILHNNQTALSIFPSPTVTPTITPTPTVQINLSLMATPIPTLAPTTILQSTNSSSSTNSSPDNLQNNNIPLSQDLPPEVLGISSRQEELITPTIEVTKQIEAKKEIKKSSIWDYIWPSITSLILGGIGYIFRKKIFKK